MTKNLTWKMVKDNPLGAIEFLVESNRIEGIGDEGSAERYATFLCYEGYKNSDYQSALITHHKNSIRALKFVIQHHQEELTVKKILKLHAIQMEGTMPTPFKAGVFREQPVYIRSTTTCGYVSTQEKVSCTQIPMLIREFLDHFNDFERDVRYSEQLALRTHYHFECIHPFMDGNGRVGRLLWLWDTLRHGGVIKPILDYYRRDWDPRFNTKRSSYYDCIRYYEDELGWALVDNRKESEERINTPT